MTLRNWIVGGALVALGALAGAGMAGDDGERGFGLLRSHHTEQTFEVSYGITVGGRPRSPEKVAETRIHVVVPSHYGELFQVTQNGPDAVLWFRASDGAIRNTLLDAAGAVPYQIERSETQRLEVRIR